MSGIPDINDEKDDEKKRTKCAGNKDNKEHVKNFKNRFVIFFFIYTHIYILKLYIFFYRTYFMFLVLYLVVHSFEFTNIKLLT